MCSARSTPNSWAMVAERAGAALVLHERPLPQAGPGQVRISVTACGVCRTDLHVLDGELPDIPYPVVPGHQVVGTVEQLGEGVDAGLEGQRVGVPWLGWTCGHCEWCARGRENLCDSGRFTGYQIDGGFATHCVADARYVLPLPLGFDDLSAAPLLCAGLIGYRCLRRCGEARHIGMYGFGAAAHVITQVAVWQGREVYAFTRADDYESRSLATRLGASWAGASDQAPPRPLDAAIIFAASGELVPAALRAVGKAGRVICGGIHMSDIPAFPYSILWGERRVESIANLTRDDAREFLQLAPQVPIRSSVQAFPLAQANEALTALREGRIHGAAVVTID